MEDKPRHDRGAARATTVLLVADLVMWVALVAGVLFAIRHL
jgi:hypothetical protein